MDSNGKYPTRFEGVLMSSLRLRVPDGVAQIAVSVSFSSVVTILTCLAALTACSSVPSVAPSTGSTPTQQSSAHILLSPTGSSVPSGGRLQFTALVHDSSHTEVRWSASAGTISTTG